jgi:surface antigen
VSKGKRMKTNGIVAAVAVGGVLSLGASVTVSLASADAPPNLAKGATTDHNPLSGYEGYCTWGAQEQVHAHAGYYVRALTGNAEDWAQQAEAAGWTVVADAQPHSIAVFSSSVVGGVGHVAWVDAVNGRDMTITEMNMGSGATVANGYRTSGFNEFDTRTVQQVPGISYIVIP